ncbi:putative sensor domain DACNV-containing protein [Paenibacillus lutimineralis]|uniref:Probable sensor domain-containing protein n=1 Tax=Paenibacillus lutimineralis TaxID=2707005 RepID=A0A3S9UUH9_9BACL|nr:hypothetical protein [Paenibacillus lutimineralis]AZS13975.1 hypothetical protein EI981_05590 [Paenibacillus lutimineralis]
MTLASHLKEVWNKRGLILKGMAVPELPSDENLLELLEISYHASLMTEEARKVKFRLAFCNPDDFTKKILANREQYHTIHFKNSRDFNVSELLRLAPATDPT